MWQEEIARGVRGGGAARMECAGRGRGGNGLRSMHYVKTLAGVLADYGVRRYEGQGFNNGLRDQRPVKRVLVNRLESVDFGDVARS